MTSHCFQLLTDQEVIDLKRTRGIMACAECQRRKLKCDKKFPCSSCVRRGRADICPTGDMGPIGRGRRVVRSESHDLSSTVHDMGDRIRQLETAVADAQAEESDAPHPLLRDDLLKIKFMSELPDSSGDSIPSQQADASGALAAGDSGSLRYFGPTAGPAALLAAKGSSGGEEEPFASPFAHLITALPFAADRQNAWDPVLSVEQLLAHLPDELQAWALYEIYYTSAVWYGTPILQDELRELIEDVYTPKSSCDPAPTPHALAVLFTVFALASLADLSLPAYNWQADMYFDLGRAALAIRCIFGSRDVHSIQALVLMGLYYCTGGPRYSFESSWSMTSMACTLCHGLRLHHERTYARMENKRAQRLRALFWEVYSLGTYSTLALGRPMPIAVSDVTCEYPADNDQTMDNDGRVVIGFFRAKYRFTKEVTAPMCELYTRVKSPTYQDVLHLDSKLRHYMETTPFEHYRGPTFLSYIHTTLIPRFCGNLMVYIHRGSFVQALKDAPNNPLESRYATSLLAAYRGALHIIAADRRSFSQYPEEFLRWWPIWKSLVNAAFVVGSIVIKCPGCPLASNALLELFAAVDLVERGAAHSVLAEGSVSVLRRLRNRATAVYSEYSSSGRNVSLSPSSSAELSIETDLEMLGGSRPFTDSTTAKGPISPSIQMRMPEIIPPNIDLWQARIPPLYPPDLDSTSTSPSSFNTNEEFDWAALKNLSEDLTMQFAAVPESLGSDMNVEMPGAEDYPGTISPKGWTEFIQSLQ